MAKQKINTIQVSNSPVWIKPTLDAAWQDFDTGTGTVPKYGHPLYYRDAAGVVHIKGLARNISGAVKSSGPIFTLPAGYRPSHDLILASGVSSGGAVDTFILLNVKSDGVVGIFGGNCPSGGWLSLSNVSFMAEA